MWGRLTEESLSGLDRPRVGLRDAPCSVPLGLRSCPAHFDRSRGIISCCCASLITCSAQWEPDGRPWSARRPFCWCRFWNQVSSEHNAPRQEMVARVVTTHAHTMFAGRLVSLAKMVRQCGLWSFWGHRIGKDVSRMSRRTWDGNVQRPGCPAVRHKLFMMRIVPCTAMVLRNGQVAKPPPGAISVAAAEAGVGCHGRC